MYQGIGPVTLKPLINFSIIKSETTWHYMLHDIKVCIIIYKVFLPKTNKPKTHKESIINPLDINYHFTGNKNNRETS